MADSRVLINVDTRRTPQVSQPEDVNGLLAFSGVQSRGLIRTIVNQINRQRKALNPQTPPSFRAYLNGNLSRNGYTAPISSIARDAQVYIFADQTLKRAFGIARPFNTGADLEGLMKANPLGRYKFYLSMNLPDEGSQKLAELFLRDLYDKCVDRKVSLGMKSEDHDYDSVNIFTFHPKEMSEILADLYKKHPTIWLNSLHPLQGEIVGVPPEHIGVVQEPLHGLFGKPHSSRMGEIGALLDDACERTGKDDVDIDTFKQACATVGVVPERPWQISPKAQQKYIQHHTTENQSTGRIPGD